MFDEIILFTDNDKFGNEMDKAFLDEFKQCVSTVDKSLYLDCKDSNEIYLKHGVEQLKKVVASG
jgi:5S rRNA maturation endonuclease (ribonuclease M5)